MDDIKLISLLEPLNKRLKQIFKGTYYELCSDYYSGLSGGVSLGELEFYVFQYPASAIPRFNELLKQIELLLSKGEDLKKLIHLNCQENFYEEFTKEEIEKYQSLGYKDLKKELEDYRDKINAILNEMKENPKAVLEDETDLVKVRTRDTPGELDLQQTVLFFHFLKEAKIIYDLSNLEMGKIMNLLTGISPDSRKKLAPDKILELIRDGYSNKFKDCNFNNIKALKKALQNLLALVDAHLPKSK